MKDIEQTNQKSNHWLKKSFSFVLLLLASVAMTTTAFKTKPALEEAITSLNLEIAKLQKEVKTWEASAKSWMKKSNDFEDKLYQAKRQIINIDANKTYEKSKPEIKIQYVKEPIDSMLIYSIIYEKKIREAIKKQGEIQVKELK